MLIKIGLLLCAAAVVVMVSAALLPDLIEPFGSAFCAPGEQLRGEVWSRSTGNRTSVGTIYVCVDAAGEERNVRPQVESATTNLFLLLFFSGMGLAIFGVVQSNEQQKRKNEADTQVYRMGDGVTVVTQTGGQLPAEMQQMVSGLLNGLERGVISFGGQEIRIDDLKSGAAHVPMSTERGSLADALRQLEDAKAQGLITDTEYTRLRQEALENLI